MSQPSEPLARTPAPPYYAAVFTSIRRPVDDEGYGQAAQEMVELAATMPGFLGIESARDEQGVGITVSYWQSLEAVHAWGRHAAHVSIQRRGREMWYQAFRLRICRVEEERTFGESGQP